MNTKLYLYISFRIVLLFSLGILFSFIPEHLRDFLGDTKATDGEFFYSTIDKEWKWGIRHYWFFWMSFSLFTLHTIECLISIRLRVLKHYPNI